MSVQEMIHTCQRRANALDQGIDADAVSRVIHCLRDEMVKLATESPSGFHQFLASFLDHECKDAS